MLLLFFVVLSRSVSSQTYFHASLGVMISRAPYSYRRRAWHCSKGCLRGCRYCTDCLSTADLAKLWALMIRWKIAVDRYLQKAVQLNDVLMVVTKFKRKTGELEVAECQDYPQGQQRRG